MDRDFINVKKIKRPSAYKNLIRQFTVQSFDNCELLLLETVDLLKMKSEFPICFSHLVENAKSSLKKELMLKLEVVRISQLEENEKENTNHVRAKFTVQMLSGIQKKIYNSKEDDGETPEKEKTKGTPS